MGVRYLSYLSGAENGAAGAGAAAAGGVEGFAPDTGFSITGKRAAHQVDITDGNHAVDVCNYQWVAIHIPAIDRLGGLAEGVFALYREATQEPSVQIIRICREVDGCPLLLYLALKTTCTIRNL